MGASRARKVWLDRGLVQGDQAGVPALVFRVQARAVWCVGLATHPLEVSGSAWSCRRDDHAGLVISEACGAPNKATRRLCRCERQCGPPLRRGIVSVLASGLMWSTLPTHSTASQQQRMLYCGADRQQPFLWRRSALCSHSLLSPGGPSCCSSAARRRHHRRLPLLLLHHHHQLAHPASWQQPPAAQQQPHRRQTARAARLG